MSPMGRTGSAPPAAAGELGGPWGAPPPLMAKGSAAPAETDVVQHGAPQQEWPHP